MSNENFDTKSQATITTINNHGLMAGDIINTSMDGNRACRLLKLFIHPRLTVIDEVSLNGFRLIKRRMTWCEWRVAFMQIIKS